MTTTEAKVSDLEQDGTPHLIINIPTEGYFGGMLSYTSDGANVIVHRNGAYDEIIDTLTVPIGLRASVGYIDVAPFLRLFKDWAMADAARRINDLDDQLATFTAADAARLAGAPKEAQRDASWDRDPLFTDEQNAELEQRRQAQHPRRPADYEGGFGSGER